VSEFDICRWRTREEEEGVREAMLARGLATFGIQAFDLSEQLDFETVQMYYKKIAFLPDVDITLSGEI
jgi:hypothetical protein